MKKKVCIVTSTRADYGLLKGVIQEISNCDFFQLQIIATGMHLSPIYGLTYREIEGDGYFLDEKIDMELGDDSKYGIIRSMGLEMILLADKYSRLSPDMVILLGDRYEILVAAAAAMMASIPIAHLCGGELTLGAVDDAIRHSITKMSYLHFASTEEYRNRIIQLGESPERVFCFGDTGVENIIKAQLLERSRLSELIGFSLDQPYAVVTFHPATLDETTAEWQFRNLLTAISETKQLHFLFTKANSDAGGQAINAIIDQYIKLHPETSAAYTSMGQLRYLSALKYSAAVIGNSSSGIVEAPVLGVPTVNIGDRQKGRLRAPSVIDCDTSAESIKNAIHLALSDQFKKEKHWAENPYQGTDTARKIVSTIASFLASGTIDLKKDFYDLVPWSD